MGLVSKDDGWRLPDELWEQMEALLPARPAHPLGCHNPRVADRSAMNAILLGGEKNRAHPDRSRQARHQAQHAYRSQRHPAGREGRRSQPPRHEAQPSHPGRHRG